MENIKMHNPSGGRPFYKAKFKTWRKVAVIELLALLAAIALIVCLANSNIRLRQELATFTNAPVIPGKVVYEIKSDYRRRK